jgi:hypothetical protein
METSISISPVARNGYGYPVAVELSPANPAAPRYSANRARSIARTLGTFTAARYLRNRDCSLADALLILCGPRVKVPK